MNNNTAFSQIASTVIKDFALYDLGQVTKGTDKTYEVIVPEAKNVGIPTRQKCKIYLSGRITTMEGTNQTLTIQMKNTTSGTGVIKESVVTKDEVGEFYTTVLLECFPNDIIEFTFIYFATEGGSKVTFTAYATIVIV